MASEEVLTADSIYFRRSPARDGPCAGQKHRHLLIYFIPGNPGLIQYYYDFLHSLFKRVDPDGTNTVYHIVGHSLGGFEAQPGVTGVAQLESRLSGLAARRTSLPLYPLGLGRQELFVIYSLEATVQLIDNCRIGGDDKTPISVVLIGHSVGAYLLMNSIEHRQLFQRTEDVGETRSVSMSDSFEDFATKIENHRRNLQLDWVSLDVEKRYKLVAGVALFPTIVDLAGSPRGRKLAPLAKRAWFPWFMSHIAHILKLLPHFVVRRLVKLITGMPHGPADWTTYFLRSKGGVLQALYMARDELIHMVDDKWSRFIWNRCDPRPDGIIDRLQLYFFWGGKDYWIDNSTRDKVIADHARKTELGSPDEEGRPYMEIDETGIPHDFCIHLEHSERVAAKVYGFIHETVNTIPSR